MGRKGRWAALVGLAAAALLCTAAPAAAAPAEQPWAWADAWKAPPETPTRCVALAPGVAGGVYALCQTLGGGDRVLLACLASDGTEPWTAVAAGPGDAGVRCDAVARHASGDAVVAGLYRGTGGGDGYVARFAAADGALRWQRRWDGPARDYEAFVAVACDRAGGVYALGDGPTGAGGNDVVLVKYSAAGRRLWTRTYATPKDDWAVDLAVDAKGNVYALATVRAEKGGESRVLLASWRPDGVRRWARQLGGVGIAYSGRGLTLRGGAVYVTANAWLPDDALTLVAKYTTAGARVWAKGCWPVVDWVPGRPQVDALGRAGFAANATVPVGDTGVAMAVLGVLDPLGRGYEAREELWSPLGEPAFWPTEARGLAVDGADRWYVAGWVARAAGFACDPAVVRWPSVDAETWHAEAYWRLSAAPDNGTFYALLRVGDRLYAGGEVGTRAMVDCIDASPF